MSELVRISAVVEKETKEMLEQMAKEEDRSLAYVIRRTLADKLVERYKEQSGGK